MVCLFLMIPILSSPDFNNSYDMLSVPMFQHEFLEMVLVIIFFYVNYLYLIPKFYHKNKKLVYGLFVFCCFIIYLLIPSFVIGNPLPPHSDFPPNELGSQPHFPPPPKGGFIPFDFFKQLIPFAFALLSSFYFRLLVQHRESQIQKSKAELLNLKNQLQPHFIFNSLNTIYALALTKSDKAPESILKLSNVMRYVMNDYAKDYVTLEEEMNYLEDYISLQKMRVNTNCQINFQKEISQPSLHIVPMILVNFIENAFKFGVNPEIDSKIDIAVKQSGNHLNLQVKNSIVAHLDYSDLSHKIGLKNSEEILERSYKNDYSLKIDENESEYYVCLSIKLPS